MQYHHRKVRPNESGFALILVLIALIILTLLGMTLSFNAITDVKISDNHKASAQAWCLAEEGIYQAKEFIRRNGLNFDEALSMNKTLPNYMNDPVFAPDTYGYRYPISLGVARTLNWFRDINGVEIFPSTNGTKDGRGILTRRQVYSDLYNDNVYFIRPAAEVRQKATGNGYANGYFAVRVANNLSNDEINLGGSPFTDKDSRVLIRSVGMVRTFNSDTSSGTGKNNSVVVLEATIRRDRTLDAVAPMVVIGPCVNANFGDGDTDDALFLYDGYDHRIRFKDQDGNSTPNLAQLDVTKITREGLGNTIPHHGVADPAVDGFGIAGLYPGGAFGVVATINSQLKRASRQQVIGRLGQIIQLPPDGDCDEVAQLIKSGTSIASLTTVGTAADPSVGDITAEITDSSSSHYNKDAAYNLLNATNLYNYTRDIRSVADVVYPKDTEIDKKDGPNPLGTLASLKVVFVDGNLQLEDGITGAGILVVNGNLAVTDNLNYTGVVLVLGDVKFDAGDNGMQTVIGSVIQAKINGGNDHPLTFSSPNIEIKGDANFYYSSDAIRYAINHLPFENLGFREVRTEYEKSWLPVSILTGK